MNKDLMVFFQEIIYLKKYSRMKTYCMKCRKDAENIDPKIELKIID